ncbi:MAG: hypothetical protein RL723_253 [Actinomycetota bacterium]|jgi:murein DD-endopeptidase MepM/ murein hydrolase activator NlpD
MRKFAPKLALAGLFSSLLLGLFQTAQASEPSLPVNTWNPPLETPIRLINQYRQPNSDFSAGHRGVDYLVEPAQPVFAPASGQIWFVGKVVDRNLVTIKHSGGIVSEFEPVCTNLHRGQTLLGGQPFGEVCEAEPGYRQHCESATCMHFSIRKDGAYLSPLFLLGGLNPSRLLPTP